MTTDGAEDRIPVTLPKSDWRLLQEALDTEIYETEHWQPEFSRKRRARSRALRDARIDRLMRLDEAIGAATGLGPL